MRPSSSQLERIDGGQLRPVIDRTLPLEATEEALAYRGLGRARGKVIIVTR